MPRRLAQQRMTLNDLEWHRVLSVRQLSFLLAYTRAFIILLYLIGSNPQN